MSWIRRALSMMMALASPFALMLLGAVVGLFLFQSEGADRQGQALPKQLGRAFVGEDGEAVHVALNLGEDGNSRLLVLQGPGGKELAKCYVFGNGAVVIESANLDSSRSMLHRRSSGSVGIGVSTSRQIILLDTLADGSAEMQVKGPGGMIAGRVRVDRDGGISSLPASEGVGTMGSSPARDETSRPNHGSAPPLAVQ